MWLKAINREDFVPTINSMVCNAHFTKDDYQNRPDLVKLTNKAVPSVFNGQGYVRQIVKQNKEIKPVRKYNNLSDHTYVLKIPEENHELSTTSTEIKSKQCNSSISVIKTINDFNDLQKKSNISEDINPINKGIYTLYIFYCLIFFIIAFLYYRSLL